MQKQFHLASKIISLCLLGALTLFAVFTLSYAWFVKSDTVSGGGMTIIADDGVGVVGTEYFLADADTDLHFNGLADGETPRMGAYSILNTRYQLLVKVYLRADMEKATVSAGTATTYFLGDSNYPLLPPKKDDVLTPDDEDKTYTNVLSSIVSLTVFSADEIGETENGYAFLGTALPSGERAAKFITDPNASPVTPQKTINLVQTAGSRDVVTGATETWHGKSCRTLFILLNYDVSLAETVFSVNVGNKNLYNIDDVTGDLIAIPFRCDFTLSFEKTD